MLKPVNITKEQTLFDIAIQVYGSIEGVKWLLEDNPEKDLSGTYESILIRSEFIREDIASYFADKDIQPSTNGQYYKGQFSDQFNNQFS